MNIYFAWYDIWVGFYIDTKERYIYFCPFPMIVIRFRYKKFTEKELLSKKLSDEWDMYE